MSCSCLLNLGASWIEPEVFWPQIKTGYPIKKIRKKLTTVKNACLAFQVKMFTTKQYIFNRNRMTLHKFKTQRPFYNPALFLQAYKTAAHFPQMIRPWLSHAHTQPHKYSQGTKMPCFFSTFLVLLKPLFVRRRAHTHTHDPAHPKLNVWRYNKKAGCECGGNKKIDMTWIEFSTSRSAWGGAEQLGQVRAPAGKQFPACSLCFCMKLMCRAEWEVNKKHIRTKHTHAERLSEKKGVCLYVWVGMALTLQRAPSQARSQCIHLLPYWDVTCLSRTHTTLFPSSPHRFFIFSHFSCRQAHLVCLLGGLLSVSAPIGDNWNWD